MKDKPKLFRKGENIVIHEIGHCIAADYFHIPFEYVTIHPINKGKSNKILGHAKIIIPDYFHKKFDFRNVNQGKLQKKIETNIIILMSGYVAVNICMDRKGIPTLQPDIGKIYELLRIINDDDLIINPYFKLLESISKKIVILNKDFIIWLSDYLRIQKTLTYDDFINYKEEFLSSMKIPNPLPVIMGFL